MMFKACKEGCQIAWGTNVTEIQFFAPGSAALLFQVSHKLHSNGCETTNDHYCSQLKMRIKKKKKKNLTVHVPTSVGKLWLRRSRRSDWLLQSACQSFPEQDTVS